MSFHQLLWIRPKSDYNTEIYLTRLTISLKMNHTELFCTQARSVITAEAKAIQELHSQIDSNFAEACELVLNCKGHIILIGMGKSGHIANKIAATLASTGTPSFFVHPAEASHGDLGMITAKDLVIAISYSGETLEVLNTLPYLNQIGVDIISISRAGSSLATASKINLDIGFVVEACPLDLAPTSSTTVTLVLGDAIAIAVSSARGLTRESFSLFHPGGLLGKSLLLRVKDIMHQGEQLPWVDEEATLDQAVVEITQKRLGMTTVINANQTLIGIFTDGDLRRIFQKKQDIHSVKIKEVMTKNCKTVDPELLAIKALELMEQHKITTLVAVDEKKTPVGVIHMHDLLQLGLYNP